MSGAARRRQGAGSACGAGLVVALALAPGCAASVGPGYALGNPDAAPRALKASGRGPMSGEGPLLVGAEVGADVDDGLRIRQGALLVGGRVRDPELGASSPSLELAGAIGLGRETFDETGETFGPLVGARVDVPIPLGATPAPSSSRMRAFYVGGAIVPYAHADLIYPAAPGSPSVVPGVEAGLALRAVLGTDMTLMDVFHQVF